MSTAYLVLENGAVFMGRSFGFDGESVGELVFTTGMTGYLETLSDPSYFGQIVLQTFPLIGNYGVIPEDFGPGPAHLKAYIVREWCQEPSNFRSEGNLDSFLREMKVPGLCGVDTRALTRMIRENGSMNAMVSKTPELTEKQWEQLRGYVISGAVAASAALTAGHKRRSDNQGLQSSSCQPNAQGAETCETQTGFRLQDGRGLGPKIAVWDFGGAFRLTNRLSTFGLTASVFGYEAAADDILADAPDGIILSGGPGDPAENTRLIGEIEKLAGKNIPIMGVGLGHQLLALALGAKTCKLRFGHRGPNQPVRQSGQMNRPPVLCSVTVQNHGYAVVTDSLPDGAVISYENLNDGTIEGIDYADIPAFSVQFDPTESIIAEFLAMTKKEGMVV